MQSLVYILSGVYYIILVRILKGDRSTVDDRLMELQEMMQRLQLLKQIGADNLVIEQEKEIHNLQQELLTMNKEASLDIIDTLPRKCRFCTDMDTDEAKLDCYEKNFKNCKRREVSSIGSTISVILKVVMGYVIVIILILIFSLITDVLFQYLTDKVEIFVIAGIFIILIVLLFRKPMSQLNRLLG